MVENLAAVTGRPGIGKTTAVLRTLELLRARRVSVGGFVTVEVRMGGRRVGFDIVDVLSGVRGTMASESIKAGVKVGRYGLDHKFGELGVNALVRSMAECDVTVVDEIGPMELMSPKLVTALSRLLDGGYVVLATVHYTSTHPLVRMVRERAGQHLYVLDELNRYEIPKTLAGVLVSWIQRR